MKISIITINYNNALGLEKTIVSILSQKCINYQYIIIDGESIDGSVDIIRKYQNDVCYWKSEPDNGIYNAMNKGIFAAKGDYILFLNSGDTLDNENTLNTIASTLKGEDIIYGDLIIKEDEKSWRKSYPDKLTFKFFLKESLPHPATFIKKDLFNRIGLYNESFKIVSDWEFFLLAINKFNCSYKHVPFIVSHFTLDGISSKEEFRAVRIKESEEVFSLHFPTFVEDYKDLHDVTLEVEKITSSKLFLFQKKLFQFVSYFKLLNN
ncbi:glycosyltransferase involved in cell wall biosynthesis [Pontibacter aydingkolensis]|uniref:Glycosyltransferase n=1 Tax=Pontibacter aydingkolensis TaxID=1911536 RepID=A0ABS7CTW6_9BACT|nr:glycosyltransferase family 2 protein [Pontibacter aydingkolensis]MBW7467220.1 glycosyltransferase [Pontibacter aydingkolensis]